MHALIKRSAALWELPVTYTEGMRVPGRIYASESLIRSMDESVLEQLANVATLPGILKYAYCMPDGHRGYGFPIGGVAAMDPRSGVISPGGIGFDINCGMRLAATNLLHEEVKPHLTALVDQLFARVPCGVGRKGSVKVSRDEFRQVIEQGAHWCVRKGYGRAEDLALTEDNGCASGADAAAVSPRAIERGIDQIGTLGSGNHYLEIQVVRPEHRYDPETAAAFGLDRPGQIVVMFHCGSRGFGHQVATDYLRAFLKIMGPKFGLPVRDRELACVPFSSREGQDYFAAMKCAINMAYANRQVIMHRIREVFADIFHKAPEDLGLHQVYDVCHNTAKLEKHSIDGQIREVLVHRKGATRAFGPGMEAIPPRYRRVGQPVIIGGSMESGSYLLVGVGDGAQTFFSTAHGAGRNMSRRQARKQFKGRNLLKEMRARGIYVRARSLSGLAEEAGAAYKDIDEVVAAASTAGISRPVVRFTPIGNIKG
ncbi:MAG: RtcB family protein [Desulfosarcina sp.]|nr:RtcB family protein [Desulfobacterales bacterium]